MAEFSEVMKQNKRMCNSIACCKCDIYRLCEEDLSRCQPFISNNPQKAEEIIMRWAAEHPEPKWPTWGEWLVSMGLVYYTKMDGVKTYFARDIEIEKPIPADIAQKLGIEPR